MSLTMMAATWALDLASTDKFVLLALADNANDAGSCWPSMATIAKKCGLTDRAVRAAMRRLEAGGFVKSIERSGTSRLFTVSIPSASDDTPERPSAPPRNAVPPTPERHSGTPERGSAKPSRTTIEPPQKASPSSEASTRKRDEPEPAIEQLPDLPTAVSLDLWDDFVTMRKAMARGPKPRPWTIGAAKGIIRDLYRIVEDGDDPAAALERSVAHGWAGVRFTDRDGGGTGGRTTAARDRLLTRMSHHDRPSAWAPKPGMEGVEPASLDDDDPPFRRRKGSWLDA